MTTRLAKFKVYPIRPLKPCRLTTAGGLDHAHPVVQTLILTLLAGAIGWGMGAAF